MEIQVVGVSHLGVKFNTAQVVISGQFVSHA